MNKPRKPRMSSSQAKRLRTLREKKSREQISEDARRAAKLSSGKFDRQRSIEANRKRWAAYHEAKAAEEAQKTEGE